MDDTEVTFNWNETQIRFNNWAPDAFGEYEYLTRNQRHFFRFDIQDVGGEIRIYILEAPSYGGRSADGHSTHRYYDNSRRQNYICVRSDLRPDTVPEALSWMVYWAEETSTYIDTGRAFS